MIELLVVITLSVILLVVLGISYVRWLDRDELIKTTDGVSDTLAYARSMAMSRHTVITVCPVGEASHCGDNWGKGIQVIDTATHEVLRIEEAIPAGYFMIWAPTLGVEQQVGFQSDGLVVDGVQGSFYLCAHHDQRTSARIVLLRTGRTRSVSGYFPACRI